jgi:NAD(P)H-hydrate epimerase
VSKTFLTRDEVREVDRLAIEEYGLPGVVLMENAGRGCADLIDGGPVVVCCGKGNNGGDGFVIARHLDNRGIPVEIVMVCRPEELKGDARINCDVAVKSGLPVTIAAVADDWPPLQARLERAAWVVDALLGTGFAGDLREPYVSAIRTINNRSANTLPGRRVLAVDVPSGLDVDTGLPAMACIKADVTATFVAAKPGFFQTAAQEFLGEVHVIDIGVPRRLLTSCGLVKE